MVMYGYGQLSSRSGDRYVGAPSALRLFSPKHLELLRFVYQSIIPLDSCHQSHRMIASVARLVNRLSLSKLSPDQNDQSRPVSRQSGMVQPVVQEMFATVHAAGSSLFGLFSV
eukprot:scaffold7703_cov103-Isochrysis_galbana.AAC.13